MLSKLVSEKLQREKLSSRRAAKMIGVSHTTISRIVNDEAVDMATIVKICNWLGVSLSSVINTMGNGDPNSTIISGIVALVESEPRLGELFSHLIDDLNSGALTQDDARDILEYAAFKIRKRT